MKTQRNFRAHICAAFFACWLGIYFELTREKWAVLIITIGAVLAMEAVNTAIEACVDICCKQKNPLAKAAKDAAAAGVLITAAAGVGVGAALFWQPRRIYELFLLLLSRPLLSVCVAALIIAAFLFVFIPKSAVKDGMDNTGAD